jgi:LCP family protein required for cell wall assembly
VLAINSMVVLTCLAAAFAVRYANHKANQISRVVIDHGVPAPIITTSIETVASSGPHDSVALAGGPAGTGKSLNFLVVGSDTRKCIDPSSDRAKRFLDGRDTGEQSDTIMILRVDPSAGQAAILSFPRDLLVKIAGTNRSNKINSAFAGGDVNRLVQTLELNFQIAIDHFVEVDFCAFKNLVDAVGGIKIPFAYPTRDDHTGLWVPDAGCVAFDGWAGLDYARSRYYQWSTDGGKHWLSDGSSDRGRIRRQQDFIKRVLQKAIDRGARDPKVAAKLLNAAIQWVKIDSELKVSELLGVAQQLRAFDPTTVRTFRIDGPDATVGDQSVIKPNLDDPTTKKILSVFRGAARLADVPKQDGTASGAVGSATTSPAVAERPAPSPSSVAPSGPTTTAVVEVTQEAIGYAPADDPTCR